VPRTSTFALTNATLPYALKLANHGFLEAIANDGALKAGVNTYADRLTYEAVAVAQQQAFTPLEDLIGSNATTG
jgi:alanine dehydrogenase